MAVPFVQTAFTSGEIAPSLFGHVDFVKYHSAASTMRNMFVSYRGGAYSRAGTKFVGFSKQTGRDFPPRMVPFQFSINQGLALEFGHQYMRVVSNGAFVTEAPLPIAAATRANPAQLSVLAEGAVASTPNNGAVATSYAPGDTVILAGGVFTAAAILRITTTQLQSAILRDAGSGYVVGDTITLAGGTPTAAAIIRVASVSGGGVATFTFISNGSYTANAPGGNLSQGSTSGTGTGAEFFSGLFAPQTITIAGSGTYASTPANPAIQASSSGDGSGATFNVTYALEPPFTNGDWVFVQGAAGMTQLNGQTYVVSGLSGSTFNLMDVYGNNIDSTAFGTYLGGGTASRIFTLATPWAEEDLDYLKWIQSADVMSICCYNQVTGTSYEPQDLSRFSDSNWTVAPPDFSATVSPPSAASGTTTSAGSTDYQYVVTALSPVDGTESIASPIADISSSVNIAATAGTITITWNPVAGVGNYNIYKAPPVDGGAVPVGALFGFAGSATGTQFTDSNITADFTQVPPLHLNPFATGQIATVQVLAAGSGITAATIFITSSTGSGFVGLPIVIGGEMVAVIVQNAGQGYLKTDIISIAGAWTTPPAVGFSVGPNFGTFPSVVSYFQERRVYASSPNNPDTYWMSQPGAFTNFDARVPTVDTDSITGTPWSVEVNGIQFMLSMPGGLVVLTGLGAWQLTGVGGSSLNPQPITPANQQAQPQAYNGCSSTVPPIKIDYDIIYLQAKGSIFRDLSYNFFTNIYTGQDLTQLSSHLFTGYTIRQAAYCEEPFNVMWAVRNDGAMLSLTYLKTEEVQGWARHDTNGLFQSICAVTEPPVDALYLAVQRFLPAGAPYIVERMDDRIWDTAEDCWCVDAALSLGQPTPVATIVATSATGLGALSGVTGLVGGQGYSAMTTASVIDDNGQGAGTGATVTLTIAGGVITGIAFPSEGSGYTFPSIEISDPSGLGSGASAIAVLDNSATFATTTAVFGAGSVGSVIRMGGGIAKITAFIDSAHVTADILSPITDVFSSGSVIPQASGNWTLTAPISTVSGLDHLAGAVVTGVADGNIISPRAVSPQGTITLDAPASAVTVGLGFTAQLQSVYLDTGSPTVQGQRKKIAEVTGRLEASRGVTMGSNQPDGSVLSPARLAPTWRNMGDVPDLVPGGVRKPYNSNFVPLYTGDRRIPVGGGFAKPGQVALQQTNPLPMQVLAIIPSVLEGDTPANQVPQRAPQRAGA